MSEHRRCDYNDEATFRYIISHFVRQSIARSSSTGCWLATSHGFTTVSPRRRGIQCSINIPTLSLLQLGSSWSWPWQREKLWPLSFGTRMASCLWTSGARPYSRLWPVYPTPAEIKEWRPGQAAGHWHEHHHSSRQRADSYILGHTGEKLAKLGWTVIPHPSYSPDLAPSDFHLFRPLKDFLRGQYFTNDSELKTTVSSWCKKM